jgi:hypothetical protein
MAFAQEVKLFGKWTYDDVEVRVRFLCMLLRFPLLKDKKWTWMTLMPQLGEH